MDGTDTPRHKWTGVLPSSSPLARLRLARTGRGQTVQKRFARPDALPVAECPPVRYALAKMLQCGIVVSIKHQPTTRTDVGSHGEAFLDTCATGATILTREGWLNRDDGDSMYLSIVGEPREETSPRGVTDGLGQLVVLHEVGDLQVLVGNQVVRRDQRVCRFPGKIFTLPTNFEIRLCQSLSGFLPIR